MTRDIPYLSAIDLIDLYSARELSPVEVMDAIFDQVDRVNPVVNALVTETRELAYQQARAAEAVYRSGSPPERHLAGIPITVKDTIATRGIRTTGGSLLAKDAVPAHDAPAPARALATGAVMLGKTNTPEFGWKGETTNRVFGTTRNPWDANRTPGGSAGGAVACVSSGMGPLAIGTDGAGSIRIPAAFTGLFGFKGTFGLVPSAPNNTLETLGHIGVASRTVRDAALLLTCLVGPHPYDRLCQNSPPRDWLQATEGGTTGLRAAWTHDLGYAPVEPEVARVAREAAFAFREAGASVEEVEPRFSDPHDTSATHTSLVRTPECIVTIGKRYRGLVDPGRIEMIEEGFAMSAADMGAAIGDRARWNDSMLSLMEADFDVLLTPTVGITAFTAGIDHPHSVAGVLTPRFKWTPFTYPMNLTGQPSATVPCGVATDGLPVGLQITGRRHDDATVLRAAAAFEAIRPWEELRPSLSNLSSWSAMEESRSPSASR